MNAAKVAMSSEASRELMGFLARLSRKLGVGQHVYVVGGAVRNFVLQVPVKDVDVVIDSIALKGRDSAWFAEEIRKAAPVEMSLATNQYGVAILQVKGDWFMGNVNLKGEDIEIANARAESYGGDGGKGYKPSEVVPATIDLDVGRRELSFNTLMWRLHDLVEGPEKAEILDLTGCGLSDLKSGIMRCPSDPDKTFRDDPSRILRVIKFGMRYGFKLSPDTEAAVRRNVQTIRKAPHSAISKILLETILGEANASKALVEMDRLGILDVIREMLAEVKPFRQAVLNWANNQRFAFFFELMDLGLVTPDRVSFLNPTQRVQFRRNVAAMPELQAERYYDVLKQPGKVFDAPALIAALGLKGGQIRTLTDKARDLLLADPRLMDSDLTDRLR